MGTLTLFFSFQRDLKYLNVLLLLYKGICFCNTFLKGWKPAVSVPCCIFPFTAFHNTSNIALQWPKPGMRLCLVICVCDDGWWCECCSLPSIYCPSYQPIQWQLLFFSKWRWWGMVVESQVNAQMLFMCFSLYSPLSPHVSIASLSCSRLLRLFKMLAVC